MSDAVQRLHPLDQTHLVRDGLGHFSSAIREEEWRARRRSRWNWYGQRFSDLSKLIKARIQPDETIPQTDDSEVLIWAMARHLQAKCGEDNVWDEIDAWCVRMAPWVQRGAADVLAPIIRDISGRSRDVTAKELGRVLRLSWQERCAMAIRTIRPYDLSNDEFRRAVDERTREIDRERSEAARRARGQKAWADHAWQAREKPWIDQGISRATWYRNRRRVRETFSSELVVDTTTPDEKVSPASRGDRLQQACAATGMGRVPPSSFPAHSANDATAADAGQLAATAQQEVSALDDALSPPRKSDQSVSARETHDAHRDAA